MFPPSILAFETVLLVPNLIGINSLSVTKFLRLIYLDILYNIE